MFWKNLDIRIFELKKKNQRLILKKRIKKNQTKNTLTWRSPYYIVGALTSGIHLLLLGGKEYLRRVYIEGHVEVGQPHQPKFRF